jgi:hypothetical protein
MRPDESKRPPTTAELSPQTVETIAQRVLELLGERESRAGKLASHAINARQRYAPTSTTPLPSPAHRSPRKLPAPAVQLLPIRGYDANGKWIDVHFDADGNPIERSKRPLPPLPRPA